MTNQNIPRLSACLRAPVLLLASLGLLAALPAAARAAGTPGEFAKPTIDIGIVVQDAARTAAFLTNAIGFTEVTGFDVSADLGKKIGLIEGHAVKVRMFVLSEGEQVTHIKILSFPNAASKKPDQQTIHATLGMRYLTLYVKDMNRALERLKAAKVPTLGETPLDLGGGTYITVVKDPDGNFIELIGPMKK